MLSKAELIKLLEKVKVCMTEYGEGWRWCPTKDGALLDEIHSALKPVSYPPDTDIVGETLLDVIEANYEKLKAAGWTGAMDSPTEVVTDLLNLLEESNARIEYLANKAHTVYGVTLNHVKFAEDGLVTEHGYRVTSNHNMGGIFDTVAEAIDDAIHRDKV